MNDVKTVLAAYPSVNLAARIEPLNSAGGMSGAQFWRIETPYQKLILRRWPADFPPPERLHFIHGLIRHAATAGCQFLPIPLTTERGESFVSQGEYLWELSPWMPGAADFHESPRVEKLQNAIRALAQFHVAAANYPHSINEISQVSPATLRHFKLLRELTPSKINDLARAITSASWADLAPLARTFLDQLPHAIPIAIAQLEPLSNVVLPMQPCLRDIWHDHILFTGHEVTGIIDFGAVDIDTPATDIARLLGSLAPTLTPLPFREGQGEGSNFAPQSATQFWHSALAAYQTVRPLPSHEIRAAHALNTSSPILAGCNWLRWIYLDHREFENERQIIDRFRQIVAATTNYYFGWKPDA